MGDRAANDYFRAGVLQDMHRLSQAAASARIQGIEWLKRALRAEAQLAHYEGNITGVSQMILMLRCDDNEVVASAWSAAGEPGSIAVIHAHGCVIGLHMTMAVFQLRLLARLAEKVQVWDLREVCEPAVDTIRRMAVGQ